MGTAFMENSYGGGILKKLKLELPYDPAIPPLDIYPKEIKSLIYLVITIARKMGKMENIANV